MVTSKNLSGEPESPDPTKPTALRSRLSAKDRRVLVESVSRDLESIEDARCRQDESSLLERIHSLKGALFIVGEHDTAHACGVVEQCILAHGLGRCQLDIDRLKQSLQQLLQLYATD